MRWATEIWFPLLTAVFLAGFGWWGSRLHMPGVRTLGFLVLAAGLLLAATSLVFFRDPERVSGAGPEVILAAADGVVVAVEQVAEAPQGGPAWRVATFMHMGNVHVQRMPANGKLLWTRHRPGKFRPAFEPAAARENEQQIYAFERDGNTYSVVQIAGLIARRIRCWIEPGQQCGRGERFGMIMYGSEVDVYLPVSVHISVKSGDPVLAGQTPLGVWP